jgi:chromosome segregation ATPase
MSKAGEFAAKLKARKNPRTGKTRNDPPAPGPPCDSGPVVQSKLQRLKAELRAARERAGRAEAALAAIDRVNESHERIFRLNQTIARLRAAAGRPRKRRQEAAEVIRTHQKHFAERRRLWKRIEELEAENAALRKQLP